MLLDQAMMIAPTVKKKSAIRIVGFLPRLSDNDPDINEPIAAPTMVNETMSSLSSSVISGNASSKKSYAPLMIPVSYPKRKPPIIATNMTLKM